MDLEQALNIIRNVGDHRWSDVRQAAIEVQANSLAVGLEDLAKAGEILSDTSDEEGHAPTDHLATSTDSPVRGGGW